MSVLNDPPPAAAASAAAIGMRNKWAKAKADDLRVKELEVELRIAMTEVERLRGVNERLTLDLGALRALVGSQQKGV